MTAAIDLSPRPIRENLFVGDIEDVHSIHLAGTLCRACGETAMGAAALCPNCGSENVREVALQDRGLLWTFTVARHRPPGDYRGPEPFKPFGIGLVELPEGVRVMARLEGLVEHLRVGQPMKFNAYLRENADLSRTLTFSYIPFGGD